MSTLPESAGSQNGYSRALFVVAAITACAVFPLILVGAGVTSKEAGMAFPDWPTSDGYLLNPPRWWQQEDTRWEHGHRLIGWMVGVCAIVATALAWRRGGAVRTLAVGVLLAIIAQGVMGGLRVREISVEYAMLHGIWGQVCFCLACALALVTSRTWLSATDCAAVPAGRSLQRLCTIGTVVVFLQLVAGAAYRHFDSQFALVAHLLWAVVVAMLVGWIAMWVIGSFPKVHTLGRLGRVLAALMVTQLFLGGLAFVVVVLGGLQTPFMLWAVPSAHVAVGALLLAAMLLLRLCARRMLESAAVDPRQSPGVSVRVA